MKGDLASLSQLRSQLTGKSVKKENWLNKINLRLRIKIKILISWQWQGPIYHQILQKVCSCHLRIVFYLRLS